MAVGKYADHLPLERQVKMMRPDGLEVDSQTLWDQLNALARHLEPAGRALRAHILSQSVIGADETHWRLMGAKSKKSGGKGKRWFAWAIVSSDAVSYQLHSTRSAEAAKALLGDYRGVVLCDGYTAYESLRKQGARFELAHCWAHVRRKFVEVQDHHPEAAEQAIASMGELYAIEREIRGSPPDESRRRRQADSKPILHELRDWSMTVECLPNSPLRQALRYMGNLWNGLTLFVDNPELELDNNRVERALRGVVLGRKNHLGSRSQRGTEVAALLYSLIESAKLCDVDPRVYLNQTVDAALDDRELPLPHQLIV